MAKIAILGGGISGLSAAYYLTKAASIPFQKILLLESRQDPGGWIQTSNLEDGTVFEHGPRSIRGMGKAGYNTLEMVEDLGLTDQVLPVLQSHPAARNRFIYVKDQLCPLPTGLGGLVKRIPPFSKSLISLAWKEPFTKSVKLEDESIHSFFTRRFGKEIADYAADPLCRGIYAGDCRQLSIKSCFPEVFRLEQEYGSLIRGGFMKPKDKQQQPTSDLVKRYKDEKWGMWSLRRGLKQLPDRLAEHLRQDPRVEIHYGAPCTGLEFSQDSKAKVSWSGRTEEVDCVVSALLAKNLASLLPAQHRSLADTMTRIPSVTVGVVNLQFDGEHLPNKAFGHLVPSSEPSKVLGMLYESCVFEDHNSKTGPSTRITCMMGGTWFESVFGDSSQCSESHLAEVAEKEVHDHLKIPIKPSRVISKLQKDCIPQYVVGHSAVLTDIADYVTEQRLPLHLVGASYKGVSVNECIHNAKQEVDAILNAR